MDDSDLEFADARLGAMAAQIIDLASGDFSVRGEITDAADEVDAVVSGLNLLGEQLEEMALLRDRAERLADEERLAYDHSPAFHVTVRYPNLRVERCNAALLRIAEVGRHGIVGNGLIGRFVASDRYAVESMCRAAAELGQAEATLNLVTAGGQVSVHATASRLASDEPGACRIMIVMQDVSRLQALEQQLAQSQRLESLGRLAGGIAHDFNNLLQVIQAHAELARREAGNSRGVAESFAAIVEASNLGAELVQRLLSFGRPANTKQSVGLVESTRERLEGFLSTIDRLIGDHIHIETDIESELGGLAIAPSELDQILLNLAVNARDALGEGGWIRVAARSIGREQAPADIVAEVSGELFLHLAVSDSGIGMADEIRSRALDPFFTTKEIGKGTGLGLSIIFGIVKAAGGTVTIDSALGRGTTVHVWMPCHHDHAPARGLQPAQAPSGPSSWPRPHRPSVRPPSVSTTGAPLQNRRVLFAEDNDGVRHIVERILAGRGFEVTAVENGAIALEAWRRSLGCGEPFALLVSDLMMPELGGVALAETIRSTHPSLPIVFMSGFSDQLPSGDLVRGTAFVRKPFVADTLLHAVSEVLGLAESALE